DDRLTDGERLLEIVDMVAVRFAHLLLERGLHRDGRGHVEIKVELPDVLVGALYGAEVPLDLLALVGQGSCEPVHGTHAGGRPQGPVRETVGKAAASEAVRRRAARVRVRAEQELIIGHYVVVEGQAGRAVIEIKRAQPSAETP